MQTKIGKIYAENGFFCPLDAITQMEAKELRKDYEAAEKDLQGDLERLALLKAYPNRLLPSFDTLTRNETLVDAAKEIKIGVPLVVRLAGTNFEEGKKILDNSGLKLISAENLDDAAKKIVEAIK